VVDRVSEGQAGVSRKMDRSDLELKIPASYHATLLRQARDAIENNGPRARDLASLLLHTAYQSAVSDADREALVDQMVADRARRQHLVLESLGLVRDTANQRQYLPGTWRMTAVREAHGYVFVVSGIRTPNGAEVSVRLTAREVQSAGLAWKAIARAIGLEKVLKPRAADWQRIWDGDYSTRRRRRLKAIGIGVLMHREMLTRERNGVDHASN